VGGPSGLKKSRKETEPGTNKRKVLNAAKQSNRVRGGWEGKGGMHTKREGIKKKPGHGIELRKKKRPGIPLVSETIFEDKK